MSPKPPQSPLLARLAETFAVAVVGGGLAAWIGIPAGWLSGAMILVGVAAVYGRPMHVPNRLARAAFVLMGMSIGTVVTPETLQGMAKWPLSIALLVMGTLATIAATFTYLRRVHGWDRLSALFGSSPGALAQVMAMSAEAGADLRAVAIVQSIRVVILSLGLPVGMALLGMSGSRPPMVAVQPDNLLLELAIMVASSVVCAVVLVRLRFPGGWIFGAMLPSAVLHGAGIIHVTLPWWAIVTMMVSMGAITGARFANTDRAVLLRYLVAAFGSFSVGMTITLVFAVASAWLLSFQPADVLIAFAPGGQDTMMMLALALGLDPVFIGAHHLARFMLISLSLPLFLSLVRARPASVPEQPAERSPIED
jgi:membrane AbrB-like protein